MPLSTLDLGSVPGSAAIPPQKVHQSVVPASDDNIYIPLAEPPSLSSGHEPMASGGRGSMVPVLKFNGYGVLSGLSYYSPHSMVYEEELYPTALHLFEARKFLDHRPDLADRIRQCERVEDVTAISAELEDYKRRDWGNVALSTVSNQPFLSFLFIALWVCWGQLKC